MTRHDPALAARLYARPPSRLEETLALHIRAANLPAPVREHRFAPPRRWRFDFAWPDLMLAAECEGATWTNGRHVRGKGIENDMEKYNQAALDGWVLLRFTAQMINSGEALAQIEQALNETPQTTEP